MRDALFTIPWKNHLPKCSNDDDAHWVTLGVIKNCTIRSRMAINGQKMTKNAQKVKSEL